VATPTVHAPLQALLDRGLAASSEARTRCRQLAGRSLQLRVRGLPLSLMFEAREDRLVVGTDGPADVLLEGSPAELALLAVNGEATAPGGALKLTGDPMLARDFRALLELAIPDLEEELSRVIGDVPARGLSRALRSLAEWAGDTGRRLSADVGEFLKEEQRSLPTRWEAEEFLDGVDVLKSDMDRLEARLRRIEQRARR
jgi:ubiquinone biosynthesis protein UbiJ